LLEFLGHYNSYIFWVFVAIEFTVVYQSWNNKMTFSVFIVVCKIYSFFVRYWAGSTSE